MMAATVDRRFGAIATALRSHPAAALTATDTVTAVTMDYLIAEFAAQNPTSKQWFDRAQASLPMGNSRTGSYYKPFPIYWESGEGPFVYDVDGNERLDFVNRAPPITAPLPRTSPQSVALPRR